MQTDGAEDAQARDIDIRMNREFNLLLMTPHIVNHTTCNKTHIKCLENQSLQIGQGHPKSGE